MNNIWQIIPNESKLSTSNCAMPRYLLNTILSDYQSIQLLKITNPINQQFIISAIGDYFDTEPKQQIIKLPQLIIKHLQLDELVEIDFINNSNELIPKKAKLIYLQPDDKLFYRIKDPGKILEKCLKRYIIIGINYLIAITHPKGVLNMKIVKIIDDSNQSLEFANINNADVEVEFLPLDEGLNKSVIHDSGNKILSKDSSNFESKSNIGWKPFSGIGYVLLTGEPIVDYRQKFEH